MATTANLVLTAACEGCGGASELFSTSCRHTTLCRSCGTDRARSRARCRVCAAPVTNLIQEFNVRLGTTGGKPLSIGRFTTGLPPFSKTMAGNNWSLHKDGLQGHGIPSKMKEKDYKRKPWILEDETGEYQYQSQLEGSLPATATYYLLMRHGKDFLAYPAGSWYNFSKIPQYKQLTLEEAEEKMKKRRINATGYGRWMMKSATHGAAAFSSAVNKLDGINGEAKGGVQSQKGNKNDDVNQDKGDEEEQEGAAKTNKHGLTMEDEEENGKEVDLDDEIEKGDDWEHEDFFSDDDDAIDIDLEDTDDAENSHPPEIKQDDNENEQGHGGLSKSGKELKELLRHAAGQDESDDGDNKDEDTDEDELPSPVVVVVAPKAKDESETGPGENTPAKPAATKLASGTPPASRSSQKRRKSGGDDANTCNVAAPKKYKIQAAKEQKIEAETKTMYVKEKAPSSVELVSKRNAAAAINTSSSAITEEELKTVLRAILPIQMEELVFRFRHILKTPEDKKRFGKKVIELCYVHKSEGQKYIFLKEEHK